MHNKFVKICNEFLKDPQIRSYVTNNVDDRAFAKAYISSNLIYQIYISSWIFNDWIV